MRTRLSVVVAGLFAWLCIPAIVAAQATGAIAGVVKDATGAVLPGVTVEASSPALIERVRVVVTDDRGNYKLVELRPGPYTVTFTLPGFSTFKREGIELTTGFTATANAEMKVGSLEETVTVTGASPLVDVQNVRTQRVLSQTVLDALPVAKTSAGLLALTLGAVATGGGPGNASVGSQDVGGNRGEAATFISVHGARGNDMKRQLDGMNFNGQFGIAGGAIVTHRLNTVGIQETVLESNSNAESETGGLQLNYVPKDGGNTFSLYGNAADTSGAFQGNNLTDELRSRGLTQKASVKKIWDNGFGVGGPLRKDKLWFYAASRWWGAQENQPGAYFNATQNTMFYTPDLSRPAFTNLWAKDIGGRLTWQAAAKHKITLADNVNRTQQGFQQVSAIVAPEATGGSGTRGWGELIQGTWNFPATNRFLFQAGFTFLHQPYGVPFPDGVTPQSIGIQEQSTGLIYNARAVSLGSTDYGLEGNRNDNFNQRFSTSYVTGSHAFKAGLVTIQGITDSYNFINESLGYTFRLGAPVSITEWASPLTSRQRLTNVGVFAQDQWTRRRLTLNYGVRFDHIDGRALAEHNAATRFVPARDTPEVKNLPNFNDVDPRFGAAYDLFGDGRTAIKASFGRYVGSLGTGVATNNHPARTIVISASRTWDDANRNYVPDCDLQNRSTNGECGGISNSQFGSPVTNISSAKDVLEGFGNREFNWQASAAVQHQLSSNVAINVGYFRTLYGNFTITRNLAVEPTDFSPYCVTAPVDPRLPGAGGNQLCGLYDVNPAKFGQVRQLVTQASNYGKQIERYNGVDIGFNAKFGRNGLLAGGVGLGRQENINCLVLDTPQAARPGYCDVIPPWSAGTQIKLNAVYPLPWGVDVSASFQNLPGAQISANLVATNAQVAPSLGRNLAACPSAGACAATVTIPMIEPYTMFEDRLSQLDLRLTKQLRIGRGRVKGMFDIYNLLNAGTVVLANSTYGASWLRPTNVLAARLFKFGAEVSF